MIGKKKLSPGSHFTYFDDITQKEVVDAVGLKTNNIF